MAFYVNTSALVNLVAEPQTPAFRKWLEEPGRGLAAGDLVRAELMRAVRTAVPDRALQAREVLDAVTLLQVTPAVLEDASRLDPPGLRSLDATHLAVALDLGDDFEGPVTYNDRLADAAVSNGVAVVAPR